MKNRVIIIFIVAMFIITLFVGVLMGLSIPKDEKDDVLLLGDRLNLIGRWEGANSSSTFSLEFFENGSLLFSSFLGNFTVNQDQLICTSHGITLTAEFFFMDDYHKLVLTDINSSSTYAFGYFGVPYGIILRRI